MYPTTFDEDTKLLETDKDKLTFNQSNMVKLRLGEKRILLNIIEMSKSILNLSTMSKKDAVKHMMKHHEEYKKCLKYV